MRVLILEDDIIIARDLIEIIKGLVHEVHFANSYDDAIKLMNQFTFDLCLSDINLNEEKTGICFVRELIKRTPNVQIIYITSHYDEVTINKTEDTNPINFIVKPFLAHQIEASIQQVTNKFKSQKKKSPKLERLTKQEQNILALIADNNSNKEISESLFISEKTVRNHRYNMIKKLDLTIEKNALLFFSINAFSFKN
jgi:DNA-binding NarL/FixJ family response regulator